MEFKNEIGKDITCGNCTGKGFVEFKKEIGKDITCTKFGCIHCCPPMTFLVCFTRNNVKIVPAVIQDEKKKNVLSGTCVDDSIMDFQDLFQRFKVTPPRPEITSSSSNFIYTEPDGKGYDFILVAHGGLLGTSKTVHYRCILNENAVFKTGNKMPLTKQTLEVLTYHMSYQYTTASKVSNTFI